MENESDNNSESQKIDEVIQDVDDEQMEVTEEEMQKTADGMIIEDELQEVRLQAADYKDKYLRGLAESENVRKRMQKERQDLVQYAVQNAILEFLTPIDHFENALKFADQAAPEVQHWAVGFQMILNQFKDVLTANGVTPIEAIGKEFDHNFHEAIEMVETSDTAPNTVVEECLRGYKMGERVIRPARVKVAKGP